MSFVSEPIVTSGLEVKSTGPYGAEVSFEITNTSSIAGAEVGQVYVHPYSTKIQRPDIELAGFAKVYLQPGQIKRLTVTVDVSQFFSNIFPQLMSLQHKAFSYYCVSEQAWVANKGTYEIRIASSSVQMHLTAPFQLEESWKWVGLKKPEKLVY